jgi:hypothetical protein
VRPVRRAEKRAIPARRVKIDKLSRGTTAELMQLKGSAWKAVNRNLLVQDNTKILEIMEFRTNELSARINARVSAGMCH